MEVVGLIVTGALAGWIAATLMRGSGYGLVVNIVIGVVGGIVGGKLSALLGVVPDGWPVNFATAVVGAMLLLTLLNLARRSG